MKNSNQNKIFGYIEGYYGKLLNWKSRKKLVEKMYANKMNKYIYAPKEDKLHRLNWRKNYPDYWCKEFKKFCEFSRKKNISVGIGLSPGLDFDFNCLYEAKNKNDLIESDLMILIKKFKKLLKFGANNLVLLLDDIPDNFNEKHKNINEGFLHAKLVNRLLDELNCPISIVPRVYCDELNVIKQKYLTNLVKSLNPKIKIFYCGEFIVSEQFKSNIPIIKSLIKSKKVIFWDNYFANDYCPNRLFLGPWKTKQDDNHVMLNLTGMINTDLFLLDIVSNCKESSSKFNSWKKTLNENNIPKEFLSVYKFFEKPNLSYEEKFKPIEFNEKIFDDLDFLIWKWKTPLSREWYPFLLNLKHDLQILTNKLEFNRILKTQTNPKIQKIINY